MSGRLEHFVTDVAKVGRFQKILIASMHVVKSQAAWGMMMMAFAGYNPGWTCDDPIDIIATPGLNMSELEALNVTKSLTFHPQATKQGAFRSNSSAEDMCELATSCSRIVFTPGTSTIVTEWALICDRAWISSLIISVQMVGLSIGSYIAGYLGDRYGRKTAMYQMVIWGALSNGITVFSVSWEMFAVCRFFIGIGVGGVITLVYILPFEFLTVEWRLVCSGFPGWYIAVAIFGVMVWLLKDWRYAHIGCTILSGLILISMYWVPESMRWLALNGKSDQAKMVAKRVCKYNRQPCPAAELIDFAEYETEENKENASLSLLFKNSFLRKITLYASVVQFTISLVFYAVGFGIRALFGNFYINFIVYSLLFIPAALFIPVIGNRLGRRWGTVSVLSASAFACFGVGILSLTTDGPVSHAIITGLALFSTVCVGSAWAILCALNVEMLPTSVRCQGYGFILVCARFGAILAPLLIPRSSSDLYIIYLIMGGLIVVSCALTLCLPDTKDQAMLETTSAMGKSGLEAKINVHDLEKNGSSTYPLCQICDDA